MKSYHKYALDIVKSNHPHVAIPAPVEVTLNEHNIFKVQEAILNAYRHDQQDSLYKTMQKSPHWSLMHDGISKFGTEFNGVYLRGIDGNNEPISVPFCLSKMKGGVNAYDTGNFRSKTSVRFIWPPTS